MPAFTVFIFRISEVIKNDAFASAGHGRLGVLFWLLLKTKWAIGFRQIQTGNAFAGTGVSEGRIRVLRARWERSSAAACRFYRR